MSGFTKGFITCYGLLTVAGFAIQHYGLHKLAEMPADTRIASVNNLLEARGFKPNLCVSEETTFQLEDLFQQP